MITVFSESLQRLKRRQRKQSHLTTRLMAVAVIASGFIAAQAASYSVKYIEVPTYGQGNDIPFRFKQLAESREICGTSVIQVEYEGDVDFRIQSAFEYACRIWEEHIPTGYPIRIKVSQAVLPTTPKPMLSKVNFNASDISGDANPDNNNKLVPISKTKSILFREYGDHKQLSCFAYNPSIMDDVDFSVVYNTDCLGMFEFNENGSTTGTYDFVSLAIRNIAQGLGFTCAFEADADKQVMLSPTREWLPFEAVVTTYNSYSYNRYVNQNNFIPANINGYATKQVQFTPVRLWEKGTTMSGFLPDNSVGLTFALGEGISYNTKTREIADSLFSEYFHAYLEWPSLPAQPIVRKVLGKTDASLDVLPGAYTTLESLLSLNLKGMLHAIGKEPISPSTGAFEGVDKKIKNYLLPSTTPGYYIQKVTGEWIYAGSNNLMFPTIKDDQFLRNRDGDYRVIEIKNTPENLWSIGCKPGCAPKVSMATVSSLKRSSKYYTTIGLKATEGLTKLEITESVRSSAGLTTTTTFEVAPGTRSLIRTYAEGSIVTLTPLSHNESGVTTKGNPITFSFQQLSFPLVSNVNISNNDITFDVDSDDGEAALQYSLTPLNNLSAQPVEEGDFNDATVIDISGLNPGIYVLRYQSGDGWESKTFTKK